MPTYWVISPEYGEVIPILDDGTGPTEYGCEVIRVEAPNKRAATVMAVRAWRTEGKWRGGLRYCYDDECPFTGLKVELDEGQEAEEQEKVQA